MTTIADLIDRRLRQIDAAYDYSQLAPEPGHGLRSARSTSLGQREGGAPLGRPPARWDHRPHPRWPEAARDITELASGLKEEMRIDAPPTAPPRRSSGWRG